VKRRAKRRCPGLAAGSFNWGTRLEDPLSGERAFSDWEGREKRKPSHEKKQKREGNVIVQQPLGEPQKAQEI